MGALKHLVRRLFGPADPKSCIGHGPDDQRFASTMFVVEATGFERLKLWSETHANHKWVEDPMGVGLTVGWRGRDPVHVCFTWGVIDGQRVVFYEPTSVVVDHELIGEWFDLYCAPRWDAGSRRASTNAMNFHHCLNAIRERNQVAFSPARGAATP